MDITAPGHGSDAQAPLVRGRGTYAGDVRLPGQAWARIVRSPVAHGRIIGIDGSEAAGTDGVLAVLTAADLAEIPTIPIRIAEQDAMTGRLQPVIAHDRVRYVGEPVALVVAEDQYTAEDAAEAVHVDIEPLDVALAADARDAPGLWEDGRSNLLCEGRSVHGDVERAFSEAAVVVDAELSIQRHTGLPMETRGLVSHWDDGVLHLWGVTKYVHFTRHTVAGFFAIEPDRVVCHRTDVGGMFGVRGEVYPEDFLVPWAARVVGRPVGWIEDRGEHLVSTNHSREQRHRFRMAVGAGGTLLAFTDEAAVDMGAYPRPIGSRLVQLVQKYLPGPYRWQAYSAAVAGVATNKTPVGTMRGPAAFEAAFVRERMLDVAAGELGLDPIELRRRNLIRAEDMPWTFPVVTGDAVTYDSGNYPEVLDRVIDRIDLAAIKDDIARRRALGEKLGLGLALFSESSGAGITESVSLTLDDEGMFELGSSAADVGQGLHRMIERVIAKQSGVKLDGLRIATGDSNAHQGGTGTYGSRTTIFVGSATADATEQLLKEARSRAAARLGVEEQELAIHRDGLSANGEHVYWKELAPVEVVGAHKGDSGTFGFGLHLAVVRVDPGTGGVEVERLAVAYDVGVAIDPDNVRSQLAGASIQALGGTLFEELAYSPEGQPLSTTFIDYLVPTAAESPRVEAYVFETAPAPGNPLGAKGAGEAGMIGVPAAVTNAVADALAAKGNALLSLPLKPGTVLAASGPQ